MTITTNVSNEELISAAVETLIQKIERTERDGWIKISWKGGKFLKVCIEKSDEKLILKDLQGLEANDIQQFCSEFIQSLFETTYFLKIELIGELSLVAALAVVKDIFKERPDSTVGDRLDAVCDFMRNVSYGKNWICIDKTYSNF